MLRTSSVLGGKNSKEKKVFPALMDSFILSTTFMVTYVYSQLLYYEDPHFTNDDFFSRSKAEVAALLHSGWLTFIDGR